jgi:YgiT-type zinc finger domain-containing protein
MPKSLNIEICPMCGKGATHKVKRDYHLRDRSGREFVIANLEFEECDFCGERIFDMEAVRRARQTLGANKLRHL